MDIQKLMDVVCAASRDTRANYHLTLGKFIEALKAVPVETLIEFDGGAPVGEEDSYRGYYHDLAFDAGSEPATAKDVLGRCERALVNTYQGYKGGDFTYGPDTPLWRGEYGCCGPAIIAALPQDGKLVLVTKDVE